MHDRRVAVRAVIVKDGKLLCLRLKKYAGRATGSNWQDYWCTPGGGVEIGEPLLAALEREIVEELGIKPVIGNLLYIQQFQHEDREHLEFFFHITNGEDYESIDLEATTHGAIEIAEAAFIDPIENLVRPVFLTKEDVVSDISKGTAKIFNNFAE